ncbi:MAG: energy transducer TonB [Deltaproteobacteria bacterium]|nr:energy transducer TonB [Deltaproteobacteria bacterium]
MRDIPRPRYRSKEPQLRDVKRLKVTQYFLPQFEPIKVQRVEKDLPGGVMKDISAPEVPAMPGLNIAGWSSGTVSEESFGDDVISHSYLEMVRLKIERHKRYPGSARARQIEGCVTIRFVITPEGHAQTVQVVKTSGYRMLDKAALRAVKDAAPFPKPPRHLFSGEIPLEITIVFELT